METLPTNRSPADTWSQSLDLPTRLFGTSFDDYELYEGGDEFVLNVDMPGFDLDDVHVSWDEGRLFILDARVRGTDIEVQG